MKLLHRRVSEQAPLMASFFVPALVERLLGGTLFLNVAKSWQFRVQTLTFGSMDARITLVAAPCRSGPHVRLRVIVCKIAAVIDQRWPYVDVGSQSSRIQLL